MTAPVVFVSYSHDTQEHKAWVLDLSTRLRQSGIDVILDQWDLGPGGDLPHFMEQSITRSARVLMICTERYVEKANAGRGGVGYERMIVTADLLKEIGSDRVIPVLRQSGTAHLPTFLRTKVYIDLSTTDRFEIGFDQLLRALLNAPLFERPPIGSDPFRPTEGAAKPMQPTPVTQIMQAVAAVYDRSDAAGRLRTDWVRDAMKTSKLFFDHALDQAVALNHLYKSPDGHILIVQESGRALLVELAAVPTSAA